MNFLRSSGVADGVGGWRSYGVDPSQFPVSLMETCERLVKLGQFRPQQPTKLLAHSYSELLENKVQLIGMVGGWLIDQLIWLIDWLMIDWWMDG